MTILFKSDALKGAGLEKENETCTLRKKERKVVGTEGKIVKMFCYSSKAGTVKLMNEIFYSI